MNWSLLAAKYPRAILRNEFPLLVLGILERNGLATEDELHQSTSIPHPSLKKTLLDLHLNELVEYGSQYIRLTEKGKLFIDRFELQPTILDDVLDSLELRGAERRDYELVLSSYRKDSFRFYQNSLCSLRVWKSWADAVPRSDSTDRREHIRAGLRSLLLRDLRNWVRHVPSHRGAINQVSDGMRALLFTTNLDELQQTLPGQMFVFIYLSELEGSKSGELELTSGRPSTVSFHVTTRCLLDTIHAFQSASEPDLWFDTYCEIAPKLPDATRYKNGLRYVKELQATLGRRDTADEHELAESSKMFSKRWSPRRFALEPAPDFLEMLLVCSTMDELLEATGLSEATLRDFLLTLQEKCASLGACLATRMDAPPSNSQHPSSGEVKHSIQSRKKRTE